MDKLSDSIAMGEEFSLTNVKVLLVEDNKVNQKVASTILGKAGCSIVIADNGSEAVERVKKETFNAILMDCQMPVMDGFEATRAIREMGPPLSQIPIIAVTAYAMAHDREKCLDCGMNDYLPKPVRRVALIEMVKKYTDGNEYNVE